MGKTIQLFGFSYRVPANRVKDFLERLTGKNTVVAIEVKVSKKGTRAYARVQFTEIEFAVKIINLAQARLEFETSYLKAWESDMDMVRPPRSNFHEMKSSMLCFGCQVSVNKFSVLWVVENVSVQFGTSLKKMYFFFTYKSVDYKLQLSYQNIWQIVLHSSPRQRAKYLVVQLVGAPRIYRKVSAPVCFEHIYSYFMETQDQWFRTTDFTPSLIGQSSGLFFELPHGMEPLNFKDNFVHYKETETPFFYETGTPFSENSPLVPILQPPRGNHFPYKIIFKICRLVQTGCIPGPKLDVNFYKLVNPERYYINYIEHALEKLYYMKECCYDPVSWLLQQYDNYDELKEIPKSPAISLDDGLVYVRRVQVTPTKVYFDGPEINVSNRVLREYRDHLDNFLRVSFVDEEWEKLYSTDLTPRVDTGDENRRTKVYERVLSTLREGITIGDKKFEFLAFSSSQLRENSAWMFASTKSLNSSEIIDASGIRNWMGEFKSIKNVAKYAARLGQSFGSSTETLSVASHEVGKIPDIEIVTNGNKYVFSDGIGKISYELAMRVSRKCGIKNFIPSAFQIRYGGYKGVVAMDPSSRMNLSLRPSMLKYESNNTKLDVLSWSKYHPCFLNRQIITLLSALGVKDHIFEKKQREAVAQLNAILDDSSKAEDALDLMAPGENTNILKEILKCGYKPNEEPFLSMMLHTFRTSKLLDLRVKARIFIPKARQMMGCLDETGTLEYGEVFVQFSGAGRRRFYEESLMISENNIDDYNYLVKGKVAVAKNPCLHPGDVRVLNAVDVPALHHMVDCVVFPQKGLRPHPNECSGSDLDGDLYFVCWDRELIPPKQVPAMDYNPAPTIQLNHDVTIEEVQEYFTNYIVNDSLGIISNAHTVFADSEPIMAFSEPCLELAKLFSIAVDFPKTGIPAEIPPHLRVKEYPDFMEKPDKTTYKSQRVIGKLYRDVKEIAPQATFFHLFTKEVAKNSYDHDMEVDGFRDYIQEACDYKTEYDFKLGNLMEYYGIKTEAEILSGGIMKMSKTFDRRKDSEAIGAAVRSLRHEARTWFRRDSDSDDLYAKASAWYHVTYHHSYWGTYNEELKRDHYISFPWCVYDKLVYIKKKNSRSTAGIERQFTQGLSLR